MITDRKNGAVEAVDSILYKQESHSFLTLKQSQFYQFFSLQEARTRPQYICYIYEKFQIDSFNTAGD